MRVGVGLWSQRSTAARPAPWPRLYAELREDARLAEDLGYDGLWLAEHHGSYDGWLPQPLVAAAAVLGATTTLRAGTAMLLLPRHDPGQVRRDAAALRARFGDRLDLGVGLGYRDEEFDAVGIRRAERGRRMADGLAVLEPPVFVGGIAEAAVRRAGRAGAGLLLPNTLSAAEIAVRRAWAGPVPTGVLVDVWPTPEHDAGRERERIVAHQREYTGAWFRLGGGTGFSRPDLLDRQSARVRAAALVGPPARIAEGLAELDVDLVVLQVRGDRPPAEYRPALRALAREVIT